MNLLTRIKDWFLNRFLPMWAKQTVFEENRNLRLEVIKLQEELERKNAYINGMVAGMKSQRRIIINTTEEKK